MGDDGAADKDPELRQLEDRLRMVGERLETPPDDAEDLLKLLSEVEECLLKVDQSPPESTSDALQPATEALVKKELLGHDDQNVRLAVASCISEITRITAPNAPYDDDVMKDVFAVIVGSFQHLDKTEGPFFGRRASILDTVAKVRSCVVMLDLDCDDLINDMFEHFVRTVSSEHSEAVKSCMETIMKLVIEESEDVHPQIASCLLQNVRKEKDSSSPSFVLAEKVISMCRQKLKPVFKHLLRRKSLSEYSEIVTSVCEEGSDDRKDNNADPAKTTVDDSKLSERTMSDESPQEPDKIEQDVSRPEKDGPSMNGTLGNAVTSDATPADNGAKPVAVEPKKSSGPGTKKKGSASSVEAASGAADDTPGPVAVTPVKRRGRPPGPKSLEKKAAGKSQPSTNVKKTEEATDSAGKTTKQSAKDDVKSSVGKAGEGESSKKHKKISSKQEKDETLSEEDPYKDLSLKEMVSTKSSTKGPGRPKGHVVEKVENITSKRKREQETKETPQSRKNKGLDKNLVGAIIKVWWPDDRRFYKGKVVSYDPVSKRHKVIYYDGDEEILLLRTEKWEVISEKKQSPMASDTPRGTKRKGSSSQLPKEEKPETPKSDGGDPPKKRGRPKGSSNGTPIDKNYATPSYKGKAESKDVKETPKSDPSIKKELEKSSKDKAARSTDEKIKVELPKDGGDKSVSQSKEVGSKGKDSKDEIKSPEGKGRPGRKPKSASNPVDADADKEKQVDKESKTSEIGLEASANASTGKKRRRKA